MQSSSPGQGLSDSMLGVKRDNQHRGLCISRDWVMVLMLITDTDCQLVAVRQLSFSHTFLVPVIICLPSTFMNPHTHRRIRSSATPAFISFVAHVSALFGGSGITIVLYTFSLILTSILLSHSTPDAPFQLFHPLYTQRETSVRVGIVFFVVAVRRLLDRFLLSHVDHEKLNSFGHVVRAKEFELPKARYKPPGVSRESHVLHRESNICSISFQYIL